MQFHHASHITEGEVYTPGQYCVIFLSTCVQLFSHGLWTCQLWRGSSVKGYLIEEEDVECRPKRVLDAVVDGNVDIHIVECHKSYISEATQGNALPAEASRIFQSRYRWTTTLPPSKWLCSDRPLLSLVPFKKHFVEATGFARTAANNTIHGVTTYACAVDRLKPQRNRNVFFRLRVGRDIIITKISLRVWLRQTSYYRSLHQ